MTTRDRAPLGAPCWAELSTPDAAASRHFYGELLGWEPTEPEPEFGPYFLFTLRGAPVAGCMPAEDGTVPVGAWTISLATDDAARTTAAAVAHGGQVVAPADTVGDLGHYALLTDPGGATVGAWQPGTFPGFTVLGEPGAPGWFELHTRDHAAAVAFYQAVFGWKTRVESDTDEFRYVTMRDPAGGDADHAGIMDASGYLPLDVPAHWVVYWCVEDVDAAVAVATAAGGTVTQEPADTPYGRLAAVIDPTGAHLRLSHHRRD